MATWIRSLRHRADQKGQSMVELALILVLIAVVVLTVMTVMGNQLMLTYQDIQEAITNTSDPGGQSSAYTCPDGTTAVLHGHKYHCH